MKNNSKSKRLSAMFIMLTMVLNFVPATVFAATHGNLEVSIPSGENIALNYEQSVGNTHYYNVDSTLQGYYPSVFSLQISPDSGVQVNTITTNNNSAVTYYSGDYYLVALEEGTTTTITITSDSPAHTYILRCDEPDGGSAGSASGIYAYLPSPGQYVNEGLNSGGWGTIYTSSLNQVKDMTDSIVTTGVSLGYFGGYVVLDYGTPAKDESGEVTSGIYNDNTNPYGVDFILYGNAFSDNSEPGCVQVSKNGVDWYDIAGSKYYDSNTDNDYSLTYTNPVPSDDDDSYDYGDTTGTIYQNGVSYTGSDSGTVTYNTWHQHSWFPLFCNYFKEVITSLGALDKVSSLSFADYDYDDTSGSELTLSGVMLGDATNTTTANYTFGYCDVHPKGSATSTAYNPYTATGSTTGGDPIDISWAVDANGEPYELDSIRFIRVYTGASAMNGAFGEISTEVCGSYRATGTGTGSPSLPDIEIDNDDLENWTDDPEQIENMGAVDVTEIDENSVTVEATGSTNVYINGISTTSASIDLSDNQVHYVQIISQSGTAEPYIIVLKLQK